MMKENNLERKYYNNLIIKTIKEISEKYPDLRFGQILFNWFLPKRIEQDMGLLFTIEPKEMWENYKTSYGTIKLENREGRDISLIPIDDELKTYTINSDLGIYQITMNENNEVIAIDPSGGPMIDVGTEFKKQNRVIKKITIDDGIKIEMEEIENGK